MVVTAPRERGAAREREDRRVRSGAVAEAGSARSEAVCMEEDGEAFVVRRYTQDVACARRRASGTFTSE